MSYWISKSIISLHTQAPKTSQFVLPQICAFGVLRKRANEMGGGNIPLEAVGHLEIGYIQNTINVDMLNSILVLQVSSYL
jgi:hypothetical protein